MNIFKKILKWGVIIIIVAFVAVVIYRIPHVINEEKTNEAVIKIHATKLTLDDVMGKNLPSDPSALADETIQGIDANQNGIRDDVELAIFKEYSNSAKTRAALLQYALALQMEVIQPIVNMETATEVIREQDRAGSCIGDNLVPRESLESARSYADVEKIFTFINFVEDKQINTIEREKARSDFFKKIGSYSSMDNVCDIDYSVLLN